MDLPTGNARYTTTVQIPIRLRMEIKAAGMSINGALLEGWRAIKERKEHNQELREVIANMEKYRAAYLRMKERVEELEGLK